MEYFDQAWERTGRAEGGYSNNPADPGGETMWGITARVARARGYLGPMRDLPRDVARNIAKSEYWDPLSLDAVAKVSPPIALELFDTNFNFYAGAAAKFLQRSLNALNRDGRDWPDLAVDGHLGPLSVFCLAALIRIRGADGDRVMRRCLNALQLADYMRQVEQVPGKEAFFFGWVLNRVTMDA